MTQSIGPPSLAQGTRIAVGFSTSISRFIPACGELSKPSWAIVQLDGSSPLARGTQDLDRLGYVADRFIPAYAGNSGYSYQAGGYITVHPRLRGELLATDGFPPQITGSSPLTRGTQDFAVYSHDFVTVHPRLRGELRWCHLWSSDHVGSSPLTRGTRQRFFASRHATRFIPAYAGNSKVSWNISGVASVHPRLRGELMPEHYPKMLFVGSSPLTRGTLV